MTEYSSVIQFKMAKLVMCTHYKQGETQLKFVTSQSGRQILNFIRQIINLSANTKHILKHPYFLTAKVADVFWILSAKAEFCPHLAERRTLCHPHVRYSNSLRVVSGQSPRTEDLIIFAKKLHITQKEPYCYPNVYWASQWIDIECCLTLTYNAINSSFS